MLVRLTERLVALALRAYPAPFRDHYARQIIVTLRDQRRAMPNATSYRVARFWTRALVDLLRSAATERLDEARLRATSSSVRRVLRHTGGIVLVAYAAGNIAYDLSHPKLSMGVFAILVTTASAVGGLCLLWRRSRSRV